MKNVFMLTAANLRKSKSQTLTMLLLVLICAMLLNVGLVMFLRIGTFFDQRAEELNAPHWTSRVGEGITERYEFVRDFPCVIETEKLCMLALTGDITIYGTTHTGGFAVTPYRETQRMNPPSLIGDGLPLTGGGIYLPYFMAEGIALGEEVIMSIRGEELLFTLAGATEEIKLGALTYSNWRVYVPQARFYEIGGMFPDSEMYLLSARTVDGETWRLATAYFDAFWEAGISTTTLSTMRYARTTNAIVAATLVTVFSLIMLVVGMIVIRFRIINGIEESMVNIGVQKAMGYRNRQIISSITLQFSCIAFVGGLIGVLAAQGFLPLVVGLIMPTFGLRWNPVFDIPMMAASLAVIVPAAALFSFITAQRIRKLHPLTALRGGISTHSFKKNPFPLEKSRGPVLFLLALKNLFMNKKQAVMIAVIMLAVTFTAVAGVITHYNINVNTEAFMRLQLGDVPDVWVEFDDAGYMYDFKEAMRTRPEVRWAEKGDSSGVTPRSTTSVLVNNISVGTVAVRDFTEVAEFPLLSGRFPRHGNEIVIGVTTLSDIGVSVGDWVTVTGHDGETSETFMVTGSVQSTNFSAMMSVESLEMAGVDFNMDIVTLRLLPDVDVDDFIAVVSELYDDAFVDIVNIRNIVDSIFAPVGVIFAAVTAAILGVVAAVVVLVLYLVIKTSILRRRRELGIQKAVGFTTLQLMNQISFGMIPVITVGAVFGGVFGYFGFNPLFTAIMRGSGIAQANLPVPLLWVAVICGALVLLAYAVCMLVAWRIRKISAYALVTE